MICLALCDKNFDHFSLFDYKFLSHTIELCNSVISHKQRNPPKTYSANSLCSDLVAELQVLALLLGDVHLDVRHLVHDDILQPPVVGPWHTQT